MRIIAGRFKGRRLVGPSSAGTRPTSDRLRETLFNILRGDVPDARVLDAFAGTGALGLEALSRGAQAVVFVEPDRRARRDIERNVQACGAESACTIVTSTFDAFAGGRGDDPAFDVILLDPPYEATDLAAVVASAGRLAAPGGLVVLEYSRRRNAPTEVPGLAHRRTVVAGDSALAFYDRD